MEAPRPWLRLGLWAGLLCGGVGCAASPEEPAVEAIVAADEEGTEDDARKAEVLQRKVDLATFEFAGAAAELGQAVMAAKAELALAEAALAAFQRFDRVTKQEEAELELQGTRDRAMEAAEELAQLEAMYREQDLDDKTREFVLSRGRRDAERAQQRIRLAERSLQQLVQEELPREETKLRLEVDRARAALSAAEHAEALDQRRRSLELDELRYELEEVTRKLEKAKREAEQRAAGRRRR